MQKHVDVYVCMYVYFKLNNRYYTKSILDHLLVNVKFSFVFLYLINVVITQQLTYIVHNLIRLSFVYNFTSNTSTKPDQIVYRTRV